MIIIIVLIQCEINSRKIIFAQDSDQDDYHCGYEYRYSQHPCYRYIRHYLNYETRILFQNKTRVTIAILREYAASFNTLLVRSLIRKHGNKLMN